MNSRKKYCEHYLGERGRCKSCSRNSSKSVILNVKEDSCKDRFAIARKFHAKNLQHKPLSDRVDDAIFTNVKQSDSIKNLCFRCEAIERCQEIMPKFNQDCCSRERKFGPVLGCKKPETHMDLAICWETPTDPEYEPPKAPHVDGSDGGLAPAVFALVQHSSTVNKKLFSQCQSCYRQLKKNDKKGGVENSENKNEDENCVLCDNFSSIQISNEKFAVNKRNAMEDAQQYKKRSSYKSHSHLSGQKNCGKNGLSTKLVIPRPKTPFARRSFCIDTLAPPFSIVQGRRDVDYPEHWRLTSVYQQSYKNPKKQKGTVLNYN